MTELSKKTTGFLAEFHQFISRGNVLDMAVGVIIGGAFGKISTSLVNDILMPLLSLLTGGTDFSQWQWVLKEAIYDSTGAELSAAVTINYGTFLSTILDFLIIAFAVYKILEIMRGTRAMPLAKGVGVLLVFSVLSDVLGLSTVNWVLVQLQTMFIVAIPVVFAPELRRALEQLGTGGIFARSRHLFSELESLYGLETVLYRLGQTDPSFENLHVLESRAGEKYHRVLPARHPDRNPVAVVDQVKLLDGLPHIP